MRRPGPWFVVGALALALGVLLTLRLASTVTSPVGGFAPTGPSAGTTSGAAVPTLTDLRGGWRPRVVAGRSVPASQADEGPVEFRAPVLTVATGCGTWTTGFTLAGDGGFRTLDAQPTPAPCPSGRSLGTPGAFARADQLRLVDGRLRLMGPDGTVLAVLDRAR